MESSTKTTRTLCKNVCVPTSMILVLVLSELVFPVMALVEQLKRLVAKRSLQRSLNYQILDYKAILDLCENEMMPIRFFGICKDSLISVKNLETEKWHELGDTVPVTWSSCYLVPLSSSQIGPKLISCMLIFKPSAYEICVYNSFWWISMVSLVDIAAGDVINIGFMHPHAPWNTFSYHQSDDSCYILVKNVI